MARLVTLTTSPTLAIWTGCAPGRRLCWTCAPRAAALVSPSRSIPTKAANAQSTTDGAIGGVVSDPTQAVIPGATVSAQNRATNASASSQTDANGRYILIHLQPGAYDLVVDGAGGSAYAVHVALAGDVVGDFRVGR